MYFSASTENKVGETPPPSPPPCMKPWQYSRIVWKKLSSECSWTCMGILRRCKCECMHGDMRSAGTEKDLAWYKGFLHSYFLALIILSDFEDKMKGGEVMVYRDSNLNFDSKCPNFLQVTPTPPQLLSWGTPYSTVCSVVSVTSFFFFLWLQS